MAVLLPLRPPGALREREFLKRCIQCGRCAQVCPSRAILLGGTFPLLALGTPCIEPGRSPCTLCMRCPPVCPTGALRPVIAMEEANMGRAWIDKSRCHTYLGSVFCKTCHEKCPLRNTALIMDMGLFPVITEHCVGCGVCEKVCPKEAIVTVPKPDVPGRGQT